MKLALSFVACVLMIFSATAQQLPDTAFEYPIRQSAYQSGRGPLVMIDEAHNNFHTKNGGFRAFSNLLTKDGYNVKGLSKPILSEDVLRGCKILVIANALDSSNTDNWILPTPSAFSGQEIRVIEQWVKAGGHLLLIADHMPFAGAATDLGKALGFGFLNGFAFTGVPKWPPSVFYRKDKTLEPSPAVLGLLDYEKIDSVATFTGSAFSIPYGATGVLRFGDNDRSLQPDTAWKFSENTPAQPLKGYYQGAIANYGKGKVALFGEAAMFTAQLVNGTFRVGINSETAPQNGQFVLNLIHWLDGITKYNGNKNAH